ncbi:MAG: S8 family serine peptidase, partial [Acidobacteriota bacterium]
MFRRGAPAVFFGAVFLLLGRPILWGASGEDVYIVHMKQPSLVERMLDVSRGRPASEPRRLLESPQGLAYRAEVQSRQQDFIRGLDERGLLRSARRPQGVLELLERRSYLVNMLVVRTTAKAAQDLAALAEVRGVFENTEFRPHLDTAPGILGAPAAWELLGGQDTAGAGIKIGVIDSGIAHLHPMFRPDGLTAPAGFPRRRIDFTNAKVIVAENYVRTAFGYEPQPEQSPRPEFGHGTQVAGAAAGRPADSTLARLSGIAPGAFLGNYKVFGDPDTNFSARLAGLLAALNDAVADSMDVINMSLGGGVPANPEQDPFHIAISNTVDLGIVVVISAGNDGPSNETIRSPAINPDALSVGSVTNGRIFERIMEVESAQGNLPDELSSVTFVAGTDVQINQDIGPLEMRSVLEADPAETACSPLPPGSLSGIVLVRRGDCPFVDKGDNVFAAGAQAMVVYNNQGEAFRMGLPDSRTFSGPSVMISQQEGEGLRDFVQAQSASATLRSAVEAIPIQAEVVSGFSSRGPNFRSNLTGIKPDLVAVGQQVHTSSSSAMYVITQGTSFAAPMVAGGAALVLQRHPNWDARAVKSALVNTALPSPTLDGQPAGVLERGNGILDLSRALDVPVVLDPVGFSFGTLTEADLVRPSGSASGTTLIKMLEVSNPGESRLQVEIEVIPVKAVPGTSFSLSSSSLDLAPGQSASLTLGLQLNGSTIQGEFEGFLRIRESASQREVTASYWGLAAIGLDDSVVLRVAQDGSQPFQTLTAALEQAGPGNVIEITDSGRYLEPFIVDGGSFRRLRGLTLRAAPGESPLLEGEVSMTDVPGVTLEGLTFGNSVSLIRSDGVIRDSLFTSVAAAGAGGLFINDGIYHVFGNSFHTDQGVGLDASSAGALIQHNAFGRQPGGEATQAGAIRGSSSLLSIFDNAIKGATAVGSPNLGPGEGGGVAFDFSPTVLFKGNTVAETQLGPGVRSNSVGDLWMISNAIRDNQGPGISLGNFTR